STNLAAINSINWARVVAQIVYYFTSFQKLNSERISFSVPTGNFGDILAGWAAKRMGLPVDKLIVATNDNDILHRAISSGDYFQEEVKATISPSMDIQISSNFERLLFESLNRDSAKLNDLIDKLNKDKGFKLNETSLEFIRNDFSSGKATENDITKTIKEIYDNSGVVLDPHTAVGFFVSKDKIDKKIPMVNLGTADPAKFPDAVVNAIGKEPDIPEMLNKALKGEETVFKVDNNEQELIKFIKNRVNN
ncbi:MAG: threonine synthase, partial [Pseudomonadota bacterium]|nr:threonine synthase [Pseudomonadota bacterium]